MEKEILQLEEEVDRNINVKKYKSKKAKKNELIDEPKIINEKSNNSIQPIIDVLEKIALALDNIQYQNSTIIELLKNNQDINDVIFKNISLVSEKTTPLETNSNDIDYSDELEKLKKEVSVINTEPQMQKKQLIGSSIKNTFKSLKGN